MLLVNRIIRLLEPRGRTQGRTVVPCQFRFAKPREPGFQLPVRPTRGTTLLSETIHIHLRG